MRKPLLILLRRKISNDGKAAHQYWFLLAIVFIALVVIGILYSLIGVRPPKEFTIATGQQGGAYYAYSQEFQRRFAEQGYSLNIRETAGGVETIDLLEKGEA
ncbi:MAG: hypothetical protein ACK2U0_15345, partial [Candidatus Promineifilaceae bacterium]